MTATQVAHDHVQLLAKSGILACTRCGIGGKGQRQACRSTKSPFQSQVSPSSEDIVCKKSSADLLLAGKPPQAGPRSTADSERTSWHAGRRPGVHEAMGGAWALPAVI